MFRFSVLFIVFTIAVPVFASRSRPSTPTIPPAPSPVLIPYGDAYSNRCVTDVLDSFQKIQGSVNTNKYLAAWSDGKIPWPRYTSQIANNFGIQNHFQGINRLNYHTGQGDYAVVSGGDPHANESHLFVVRMDSRSHSWKWGGNLKGSGDPDSRDKIVATIDLDGTYWHAGGMQVNGRTLAVPVENSDLGRSRIYFYDMQNPASPLKLGFQIRRDHRKAGAAAFTRLPDGRFLTAAWSDSDSNYGKDIEFYLSNSSSLGAGFSGSYRRWSANNVRCENGQDCNFSDFQTINFVNQCDGRLFMIGTHNTSSAAPTLPGKDYADLYRLDFPGGYGGAPNVTKVANKHLYCHDSQCNFDAGGGVYVADSDRIWIYGAYHWLRDGNAKLHFNEYTQTD